ncbi:CLIP-associating protein 1 [Manis javanica]|nr:CLIP-associating protein 1 [Manis javanica]
MEWRSLCELRVPLRMIYPPCGMAAWSLASSSALMKCTVVSYSSKYCGIPVMAWRTPSALPLLQHRCAPAGGARAQTARAARRWCTRCTPVHVEWCTAHRRPHRNAADGVRVPSVSLAPEGVGGAIGQQGLAHEALQGEHARVPSR